MSNVTKRKVALFLSAVLPGGRNNLFDLPFDEDGIGQGSAFTWRRIPHGRRLVIELAVSDFENVKLHVTINSGPWDVLDQIHTVELGSIDNVLSNQVATSARLEIKSAVTDYATWLLDTVAT